MKRLSGLLLFLSILWMRTASAAPCLPDTLQGYIGLGATGCSVGAVVFADFAIAPGQSFATPIDPAQVQVTPGGTAETPTLLLAFEESASAGELLESFFHFNVSAPTLLSAGVLLALASATGDGVVTATQDVCPDGLFSGNAPVGCSSLPVALITFLTESDSLLSEKVDFAAAGFFDVFTDVVVDGGISGSASLGSVTLSFSTVPEPSTAALFALGLALLSRLRTRARR